MKSPFISRVEKVEEGLTIGSLISKRTTGEVGLEIECEGNVFRKESLPKWWDYHKDGSLRGKDNAEYVLKKPIKFSDVPEAVKSLWDMFAHDKTKLDLSNRTSVHVHLNMQKFHLNRLTAFLSMWFALEDILTEWCGDHRVGNLFCLRAKDAHSIITELKRYIRRDGEYSLGDGFHYAGLNAQALQKFGSIEIRTLRGPVDPEPILDWVALLERIWTISNDFPDPRGIIENFSGHDPIEFMDMILGPHGPKIRSEVELSTEDIRERLHEGIRLAQDLSYCRDWSKFSPFQDGDDPFRRDLPRRKKSGKMKYVINDEGEPGPYHAQYGAPTPAPQSLNPFTAVADEGFIGAVGTGGNGVVNVGAIGGGGGAAADLTWVTTPTLGQQVQQLGNQAYHEAQLEAVFNALNPAAPPVPAPPSPSPDWAGLPQNWDWGNMPIGPEEPEVEE